MFRTSAVERHGVGCRSLASNMIEGCHTGFSRSMELRGVGYRAAVSGRDLTLNLGLSHPVIIPIPAGIDAKVCPSSSSPVSCMFCAAIQLSLFLKACQQLWNVDFVWHSHLSLTLSHQDQLLYGSGGLSSCWLCLGIKTNISGAALMIHYAKAVLHNPLAQSLYSFSG